MILGLNANWKMSMFWEAGAANYLYMAGFLLAFLFCYLKYEEKIFRHRHLDPSTGTDRRLEQ